MIFLIIFAAILILVAGWIRSTARELNAMKRAATRLDNHNTPV